MSSFATRDDVLARAGRLGGAFSVAGKRPTLTDLDAFAAAASEEVAEAIRGAGFDPTTLDTDATQALADLAAYGALGRALRGLGDASPQVQELLAHAELVWSSAMGAKGTIADGSFPVIRALAAGAAGGGPVASGGSFWGDEPGYGTPDMVAAENDALHGGNTGPGFRKEQKL